VIRELGTRADPRHDAVTVDGRPVLPCTAHTYLALNKPPGFVSTVRDPAGRATVMELVPPVPSLFPVGRLDEQSEGLLLFTTDGDWAQHVLHPRYGCTKEYIADVEGRLSEQDLQRLRAPMRLGPGEWTSGAEVDIVRRAASGTRIRLVLREGRKRQVRRMLALAGHPVRRLVRVRVGLVKLGGLNAGEWRPLTPQEVEGSEQGGRS
jgi:23S rRNA pseudouridine2605 synthase